MQSHSDIISSALSPTFHLAFKFYKFPVDRDLDIHVQNGKARMSQENDALKQILTELIHDHVDKHEIPVAEWPSLISRVQDALRGVTDEPIDDHELLENEPSQPQPAVPVTESITPDYIVCLEDGKKLKILKRHLRAAYNMSPEEYRARWNLPIDYPMVAPNYAEERSKFAKEMGLGKKRGESTQLTPNKLPSQQPSNFVEDPE